MVVATSTNRQEESALGPIIVSHVYAGVTSIDDLVVDDERNELVEQMNLHGNSVQSLDGLEAFTGLVELCLSSNYVEEIAFYALQPLVHLRVLDLSANSISSTLGFPQLPRLEELSIAHNCLQSLDGLLRPIKFPSLRYMDLRGNDIEEFNDLISLQRLKRLSHLRLQAANGDQANPVCDLEGYHRAIIKILPQLELLDEEEVEFLKEMGSLHMPKYRSLMCQVVESKRSERHTKLRDVSREVATKKQHEQKHQPPNQRKTDSVAPPFDIQPDVVSNECLDNSHGQTMHDTPMDWPLHSPGTDSPNRAFVSRTEEFTPQPQQRLVVKDSGTNTEVNFEKEILRREQLVGQREAEVLENEKLFLTKENEFFVKEKNLKCQVTSLEEQLKIAQARAAKAETTVLEMSNHLLQKEKDQACTAADRAESVDTIRQRDLQHDWDTTLAALKESHHQELQQLTVEKDALEKKLAKLRAESGQKHREIDQVLQQKAATLEKSEKTANELATQLELARKAHDATLTKLSDEIKHYKDRMEQADKRNIQLEKQVAELKANVETVYDKCIEKDEAIQQSKKTLAARQDEIETLRLQHAKDSERQDKLQQQQQDLYERQLQASIIQIEMEFRKEHQQSAQRFQLLQRKTQERLKEIKRVREAYQVSLQRESIAKAEVEKLQAILADDKKKLFVEDIKRSDSFKAKVREERAQRKELEQRLIDEQRKGAQVAVLSAELDEKKLENEQLRKEILQLQEQQDVWKKLEDDLRAAIKVKDVMLADHLRQIKELTSERQNAEAHFNDEVAELQAQIEDLEAALDESLQKAAEEEVKNEALSAKLVTLENDAPKKEIQLKSLRSELEQKVSALEFLDQEMQRMRTVLKNQDELFHKRLQKHLEQHREEIERVRAGAEEERERQLHGWEIERSGMMHKYEDLATKMESVAAQNVKLRASLDQEQRKSAQNDRDMRILLAQIDRERQSKKENLRQIKSLFEQLQRESS